MGGLWHHPVRQKSNLLSQVEYFRLNGDYILSHIVSLFGNGSRHSCLNTMVIQVVYGYPWAILSCGLYWREKSTKWTSDQSKWTFKPTPSTEFNFYPGLQTWLAPEVACKSIFSKRGKHFSPQNYSISHPSKTDTVVLCKHFSTGLFRVLKNTYYYKHSEGIVTSSFCLLINFTIPNIWLDKLMYFKNWTNSVYAVGKNSEC